MNGERDVRAGEYVLGLMDEEDRARAERDLEIDAEFRAAVTDFAERMRALDANLAPEPVPDDLWQRVVRDIALAPQMTAREAAESQMKAVGMTPRAPDRHGHLGLKRPLATFFGGFRGTMMAASILAACALGYMVGQASVTARDPAVVVLLANENDEVGAYVEAYGDDRVRIVPLADFDVPPGKVLEVWTLFDEGVGPVSIGTIDRPREAMLTGPALPAPRPDQLYEITLEDAPRSPAGRPLGPILVKGLAVVPPR